MIGLLTAHLWIEMYQVKYNIIITIIRVIIILLTFELRYHVTYWGASTMFEITHFSL